MEPSSPQPTTEQPDLATIAVDILGDMAFMVTDDVPSEVPPGTVWMQAEVGYSGPRAGHIMCWCTREFGASLAANLLGIDVSDSEAEVGAEDALRELMNVLCGQLATAWYGTEAVFDLTIPTVAECIELPECVGASDREHCQVSIEGEVLFLAHEQAG